MSLSDVVSAVFLAVGVVLLVKLFTDPPKQAPCSCKRCEGCAEQYGPHVHLQAGCDLHDGDTRSYSWVCPRRRCGWRFISTDASTVATLAQEHQRHHEQESGRA